MTKLGHQLLARTNDPRVSMFRKFAQALGVPVEKLFAEEKKGKKQ